MKIELCFRTSSVLEQVLANKDASRLLCCFVVVVEVVVVVMTVVVAVVWMQKNVNI